MPFDMTDAYENIKQLRSDSDIIIQRQEFILDALKKEGITNEDSLKKYMEEAYKEGEKDGTNKHD